MMLLLGCAATALSGASVIREFALLGALFGFSNGVAAGLLVEKPLD